MRVRLGGGSEGVWREEAVLLSYGLLLALCREGAFSDSLYVFGVRIHACLPWQLVSSWGSCTQTGCCCCNIRTGSVPTFCTRCLLYPAAAVTPGSGGSLGWCYGVL